MKILFIMGSQGHVRNFESVIVELAQRGHSIHLGLNEIPMREYRKTDLEAVEALCQIHGITYDKTPDVHGFWNPARVFARGGRDFVRFFDPRYDAAPKLRERTHREFHARSPLGFLILRSLLAGRPRVRRGLVEKGLSALERGIPLWNPVRRYIESHHPDVLLITPVVDFASDQVEYLKCAKAFGIPTCLCVHSWDNLTNKGLIRVQPDQVIVWNAFQKEEAVTLHGIDAHRVVVTGAQCYDKWFDSRPGTTREEFCAKVGFPADKPFVLFVGSSPFIASDKEPGFVETWVWALRSSPDPRVSNLGILIRPHPQNARHWEHVHYGPGEGVAIFPRAGANPINAEGRADFFDSMHHSDAVIGINTSAMIESGIVGKPVLTVLADEFRGAQDGTLHFHYLVEQGLLRVAGDLPEHVAQLSDVLANRELTRSRVQRFVEVFVRPHGIETPATPLFVDAVEQAGRLTVPQRAPAALLSRMGHALLFPLGLVFFVQDQVRRWARKGRKVKWTKSAPDLPKKAVRRLVRKTIEWAVLAIKALGLAEPVKRYLVPRLAEALSDAWELRGSQAISGAKKTLPHVFQEHDVIVAGPWLAEVGFEILYWVPFLRWVRREYAPGGKRLVALSRGGTGPWYRGITDEYVDAFSLISTEEFRRANTMRWRDFDTQKQRSFGEIDERLLHAAQERLQIPQAGVLHPSVMFRLFKQYWEGRAPFEFLSNHTIYEKLAGTSLDGVDGDLPRDYVAVRFYSSPSFPDTLENREFVATLIHRICSQHDVVLLNPGFRVDDHVDFEPRSHPRLFRINRFAKPETNLAVQTNIIGHARAFIGTSGGLAYVAPFLGVPGIAIYSHPEHSLPVHLATLQHVVHRLGTGFAALHVRDLALLEEFLGTAPTMRREHG